MLMLLIAKVTGQWPSGYATLHQKVATVVTKQLMHGVRTLIVVAPSGQLGMHLLTKKNPKTIHFKENIIPNWCSNMITLGHNDPAMIKRAKDAFADGRFLNEFIPCPAELNDDDLTTWSRGPEQEVRDKKKAALKEKYGYESWYDWNIDNYGTKWDVGNAQGINTWDDHEFIAYFDSAWSPPIAAYDTLTNQGFTVYATWYEPGSAFAGIYDEHGVTDYDLSGMDSGDVEQQIPQELNEQFGISESMAEYEREEEDEVTTWYKDGVADTGLEPHVKPVAQ